MNREWRSWSHAIFMKSIKTRYLRYARLFISWSNASGMQIYFLSRAYSALPLATNLLMFLDSPSERVWLVIVSNNVTSRSNFVNQSLHMSSPICSSPSERQHFELAQSYRKQNVHSNQFRADWTCWTCPLHEHRSDLRISKSRTSVTAFRRLRSTLWRDRRRKKCKEKGTGEKRRRRRFKGKSVTRNPRLIAIIHDKSENHTWSPDGVARAPCGGAVDRLTFLRVRNFVCVPVRTEGEPRPAAGCRGTGERCIKRERGQRQSG